MLAPMRIAIAGASGLIGSALAEALTDRGDEVVRLVRHATASADERAWQPEHRRIDAPGLDDVDAVVNLAGPGIADKRWSPKRRGELRDARVAATRTIADAVTSSARCRVFCSGSAVGFYGDTHDAWVDESWPRGGGFLPTLVAHWEHAASGTPARTVYLRTGLVFATEGGILAKQLPAFRLGLGGRVGDGRQYLPWITLTDEVRAILHCLDTDDVEGPVNLASPHPVTNERFTTTLGAVLHRPTALPLPLPAVRTVLGDAAVREMLLVSNRLVPARLKHSGFTFTDPHLAPALVSMLR